MYDVSGLFTRDQNIDYPKLLDTIASATQADGGATLLYEQRRSVMLWEDMIRLAEMLEDDCNSKQYILTTCRYGYCLFSLYEQIFKANVLSLRGAAQEAVDECIGKVADKVISMGGAIFITADHGNADIIFDENNLPFSAHTTNPVPFLVTRKDVVLHETGNLGDITPTMLDLLNEEKPVEMTGRSMIKEYIK